MVKLQEILQAVDGAIGGSGWFVFMLLGVGIFFTFYLGFPQIRYFNHAIRCVLGKYDKKSDKGDTSHFQALTTALSGTVGTGNIAGVALAIHLGGPGALFWMLVTAVLGMCTKFVEVTLSHKYREFGEDGTVSGGPMYYMKKRLNIKTGSGKMIKTGYWMGGFFAVATVISSFGTGNLPQINGISNSLFSTFGINKVLTGLILAVLLGLVIIGGIKRIAKVTSRLVPAMAIFYFIGALGVLITNYSNILPSFASIFTDVFTGTAATGGFLGASFIFAFNRGVNRGLFSNEAGQGSAPIAHSAARAHEPVSEGFVAILEPFIDTIIICFLTGMVILSSGVWNEKLEQKFQYSDMEILNGVYRENNPGEKEAVYHHLQDQKKLEEFTGDLDIINGKITNAITFLHARSIADHIVVKQGDQLYTGKVHVTDGNMPADANLDFYGKSLMHSAPLTAAAFTKGLFGSFGQYIVSIGLLLFAFSTAISWSYYGDRAVTYLVGSKWVVWYRIIYVLGFFVAAFVDTTLVWILSGITIAFMTIPNLIGIFLLHGEMKTTVKDYWTDFIKEHPESKIPRGVLKN
ncbi:alanine/glycine:cation symporter family protein [Saccharicrinis sp. FJH2]|uniref:alanine/glycine:cation symporter family protein n=1 Tax=Saccharicrinis sp. FJH65 TaxID=3344659 RepID=UPI0035F4A9F6